MSTTILLALVMGIALVSLSGGCAVKPSDGKRAESAAIPQAGHANAVQGAEATPEIGEFLRNYRSRLSASTDPTSLQTWAKSTLARMRIGEKRKPITLGQIPQDLIGSELKKSLISITAIKGENEAQGYVLFLCGGGRGFYGVEVGGRSFVPVDVKASRLTWSPGVFVYFLPPF
ncbi:MAG TPA: hypothetical protein PLP12_19190 [Verrucomicrobiota bacterium]|jgi:hypothetical protein|nr:hypothetical protein [Verrucomicrobiota bacterium]HQK02585.1 hypothetical protein [Verrucomicrobiota bacterium]